MNRRGFFAALLAPLLVRLVPKANPAYYNIGVDCASPGSEETVLFLHESGVYQFGWTGFRGVCYPFD